MAPPGELIGDQGGRGDVHLLTFRGDDECLGEIGQMWIPLAPNLRDNNHALRDCFELQRRFGRTCIDGQCSIGMVIFMAQRQARFVNLIECPSANTA